MIAADLMSLSLDVCSIGIGELRRSSRYGALLERAELLLSRLNPPGTFRRQSILPSQCQSMKSIVTSNNNCAGDGVCLDLIKTVCDSSTTKTIVPGFSDVRLRSIGHRLAFTDLPPLRGARVCWRKGQQRSALIGAPSARLPRASTC